MKLDIVTPERRLKSVANTDVQLPCETNSVIVPGLEGQFEVLPGHEALLSQLGTGVLSFSAGGSRVDLMVSGGFCEVDRDTVTIMCESAALAEEVDKAAEESAHADAQKQLASLGAVSSSSPEFKRLKAETERAASKLTLLR